MRHQPPPKQILEHELMKWKCGNHVHQWLRGIFHVDAIEWAGKRKADKDVEDMDGHANNLLDRCGLLGVPEPYQRG